MTISPASEKTVEAATGCASKTRPIDKFVEALVPLITVFGFWMFFSSSFITFYRDDNVTAMGPLIVEAARQVSHGLFPWSANFVGGGGGTPLVSIMQPGVLNPLNLIPAIFLRHDPEMMINVIVCLHLALFAWGGLFLANSLRAPAWAGLVAAFSLGFSGSYVVGAGNAESVLIPFTFLPWLIGGLQRLLAARSCRELMVAHAITAWAALSTVFSGAPTAGFYGFIVVCWACVWMTWRDIGKLKILVLRLLPQVSLFLLIAGPLLWSAWKVYVYYGRHNPASTFVELSVPLRAYLGLLVPQTESLWQHVGVQSVFTNYLLFCGGVVPWFILVALLAHPLLLREGKNVAMLFAIFIFVPFLSPDALGLADFFSKTPVLGLFRWPYRGITALHVLIVFFFLTLFSRIDLPRNKVIQLTLVAICFASGIYALSREFQLARPGLATDCWFTTNKYFEDRETWSESTMNRLRGDGYLITISRLQVDSPWYIKPRLFFTRNLGAQLGVRTVHRYVFGQAQSEAYRQTGMTFDGLTFDWKAVKRFIETSRKTPSRAEERWANGIGPRDYSELAEKTFVGAVVVDTALGPPMKYFLDSNEWKLLEKRQTAAVFVRNTVWH